MMAGVLKELSQSYIENKENSQDDHQQEQQQQQQPPLEVSGDKQQPYIDSIVSRAKAQGDHRYIYWWATVFNQEQLTELRAWLSTHKQVSSYLISAQDKTPLTGVIHWHVYIQFTIAKRRTEFKSLNKSIEFGRIEGFNGDSWYVGVKKYINYIKRKGKPLVHKNMESSFQSKKTPKRNLSEEIKQKILSGRKMKSLCMEYPHMVSRIGPLMMMRPRKYVETDCLYIHGPSGIGKTTMMKRITEVVKTYHYENEPITVYNKLGGFSKWWDGYDNQEIVIIDDPSNFSSKMADEQIQQLKTVLSPETNQIQIKYGSMVFDSKLVIILSNYSPEEAAKSAGSHNYHAILRRFTDSCGAYHIENAITNKEYELVFEVIAENFEIDIDFEEAMSRLPDIRSPKYGRLKRKYGAYSSNESISSENTN